MQKFFKITEVSKMLDLVNLKDKKPQNHILRFWEREFKNIKPKIINRRRYYTEKQIDTIRLIKFLLKGCSLDKAIKLAPKIVSGLVVKIFIFSCVEEI